MMRSYVAHALHWCEMHVEDPRYEIMEIKHGRAAMLGFLHVIAIEVNCCLMLADSTHSLSLKQGIVTKRGHTCYSN